MRRFGSTKWLLELLAGMDGRRVAPLPNGQVVRVPTDPVSGQWSAVRWTSPLMSPGVLVTIRHPITRNAGSLMVSKEMTDR